MTFYYSRNRPARTEIGDESTERGIQSTEGSLESKDLCQTLSKVFDMSKAAAKVSQKRLRKDDQKLVKKAR